MPAGIGQCQTLDAYALDGQQDEPFDAAFAGFWKSRVPLRGRQQRPR